MFIAGIQFTSLLHLYMFEIEGFQRLEYLLMELPLYYLVSVLLIACNEDMHIFINCFC